MRAMTLFLTVGPMFEALAASIGVICVGRLLSGIGAGAATVVVPIYISEIAPPKEKGLFGALTQIMINVGILLAQLLGYFLSKGNLWRIILAVSGAIGILQSLGLWLVPESPKWLAEHRNPQRAREILRKIRGRAADLDEEVRCWNIDSSAEDIGLLCATQQHGRTQTDVTQEKKRPCFMPTPALIQSPPPKLLQPPSESSMPYCILHIDQLSLLFSLSWLRSS